MITSRPAELAQTSRAGLWTGVGMGREGWEGLGGRGGEEGKGGEGGRRLGELAMEKSSVAE